MDCTEIGKPQDPRGTGLLAAVTYCHLAESLSAARRLVEAGGISVNGKVQRDTRLFLDFSDALHDRYYLLRRGKKNWRLLVLDDGA